MQLPSAKEPLLAPLLYRSVGMFTAIYELQFCSIAGDRNYLYFRNEWGYVQVTVGQIASPEKLSNRYYPFLHRILTEAIFEVRQETRNSHGPDNYSLQSNLNFDCI